ncbi:MAG TPA: helix-turn-helix domain-containing protein [Pyrinomonadaceae bacterium]|nr:helix-turn-helix domain-containing protein [Pyrinomonadaceae bacterium]
MAATFGEQLRLAREARGITLREISEQTRISTRYLEAIESDDYKRLPGGIFNKSFIKAYAKYIGFDEKEALEAYARTAREQGTSPDDVVSTPYQPRVYTDGNSRSPLVTLLLTILILAIISLGVYAAMHWYQRREATAGADEGSAPATAQQPAQTGASQTTPASTGAAPAANTAPGAATAPTGSFTVQIKARGESVWTRSKVDDGVASELMLQADETREFKPNERVSVLLSRSKVNALEVIINNRPAKVTPEPRGNLAEIVITKENYEQLSQ